MGLHLRGRSLQLSPYEESGDSIEISRARRLCAGPKMNPRGTPADPAGILPELQNHWGWKETKARSQFFRSLIGCPGTKVTLSGDCLNGNVTLDYFSALNTWLRTDTFALLRPKNRPGHCAAFGGRKFRV